MVVLSMGGEARSTPSSYHTMNSPRYGGCVGAFLHFFDWNPGKRFYSTKRLAASECADPVFRMGMFFFRNGQESTRLAKCMGG